MTTIPADSLFSRPPVDATPATRSTASRGEGPPSDRAQRPFDGHLQRAHSSQGATAPQGAESATRRAAPNGAHPAARDVHPPADDPNADGADGAPPVSGVEAVDDSAAGSAVESAAGGQTAAEAAGSAPSDKAAERRDRKKSAGKSDRLHAGVDLPSHPSGVAPSLVAALAVDEATPGAAALSIEPDETQAERGAAAQIAKKGHPQRASLARAKSAAPGTPAPAGATSAAAPGEAPTESPSAAPAAASANVAEIAALTTESGVGLEADSGQSVRSKGAEPAAAAPSPAVSAESALTVAATATTPSAADAPASPQAAEATGRRRARRDDSPNTKEGQREMAAAKAHDGADSASPTAGGQGDARGVAAASPGAETPLAGRSTIRLAADESRSAAPVGAETARPAPIDNNVNEPTAPTSAAVADAARRPSAGGESAASPNGGGGAPQLSELERVRFVQRVSRAFQTAIERGAPLRLRLSPPELGALRLEVTVRDGALSARLEAESPAAQAVLLDNLPGLRDRLSEQNIRIERFEVGLLGQSTGQPQEQSQRQESSERGSSGGPNRARRPAGSDAVSPRRTSLGNAGSGHLNVIV